MSAQIHGGDDDVMQVRLEGTKLVVQYDDGKSEIVMDGNYKLGTVFDVKIVAAGGRVLVSYNGVQKAEIKQSGSGWYFKSGSYLQSNTSKGDKPKRGGNGRHLFAEGDAFELICRSRRPDLRSGDGTPRAARWSSGPGGTTTRPALLFGPVDRRRYP